jgi:predicted HTH domain antitoxin
MEKVVIELPDEAIAEVEQFRDRLPEILLLGLRQLKAQEALWLYQEGIVSLARAAEIAGTDREHLIRQARAAGVAPRRSDAMAAEELA